MTDSPPGSYHHPGLLRRVFALSNVVAVACGLVAFAATLRIWNSNRGAVIAALVGGTVSAVIWLAWNRFAGLRPVGKLIDLPLVGAIPAGTTSPTPTLTAPDSAAAAAYQRAASRLEAATRGRVLLVAGMTPGQGATTAALNLAVAATRAGRRALLVDGDLDRRVLSRFGRTGSGPGLAELSNGSVEIRDASRLWAIDAKSRLPFIPAGAGNGNGATPLDGSALERALADATSAADLVLIDTAATREGVAEALGQVADGTLLVLPRAAYRATVDEAQARADRIGAPPVGYLINEAAPSPPSIDQHPVLRSMKRAFTTALLVLLAYSAWNGAQVWSSWRNVERQGFDVSEASALLPISEVPIVDDLVDPETENAGTALPSGGDFTTVLIVGSDLSGSLADVIMLAILPGNGDDPTLVSIPRDLYLQNRCTHTYTKINANLAGCDNVNGPTMLGLAVTEFTGVDIDHFALFTFEGFEEIIDQVGGIEICVDYPVRDSKSDLNLDAGCTRANGAQALAWVRSRHTQELVNGRWRTMPGVSDLTRNQRQQDVLVEMFTKLRDFSSPADFTQTVRSLTNAFTLDDELSLTDAIRLAWSLRDIDPATIQTIEIPVEAETASNGAAILLPTVPFHELLRQIYPDLVAEDATVSLPAEE